MDVSLNRAAKAFLEREFQDWYSKEILRQMNDDHEPIPVNLTSVEMKHIGAQWLVRLFEHVSNNPHLVVNGFIAAGITGAFDDAHGESDIEEYEYSTEEEMSSEVEF